MKSSTLLLSTAPSRSLHKLLDKLRACWLLIKDLQTGLLMVTAVAGFTTACCSNLAGGSLLGLLGSLFLTIGGSTVLNMVIDRDIDAKMSRTAHRPLPTGRIQPWEAWLLGSVMILSGLFWALWMYWLFALVVAAGIFLDVVVYTLWLKRRTPFSILLGGLSGGMPILAGRTLALGQLDALGFLLAIGILLWIPTHIMTFSIKYQAEYSSAGVPTFPGRFGVQTTRWIIAASTLLAVGAMATSGWLIALPQLTFWLLLGLGGCLMVLVILGMVRPSKRLNFALYKGASIYMLFTMFMIIAGGF